MAFLEFVANDFMNSWQYIVRMLLAAACGALIGMERTRKQKEAGTRTHVIVAVGAAMMMIISKYGFFDVIVVDYVQVDPSKIAAQVVTGVGFLGAGVIFFKNDSIKGLTTAAGVWATAGVGLAMGAGLYSVSVVGTIVIIVIHYMMHRNPLKESFIMDTLLVTVYNEPNVLEKLKDELKKLDISVKTCHVMKHKNGTITVRFQMKHSTEMDWSSVLDFVQQNEYVKSIDI